MQLSIKVRLIKTIIIPVIFIFDVSAQVNIEYVTSLQKPVQSNLINISYFESGVINLNDINGDGYPDWAIGSGDGANPETGERTGSVFIFLGNESGLNIETPDIILYGNKQDERFGVNIAGGSDLNNDGYYDFIVASPNYSDNNYHIVDGSNLLGKISIFYGSEDGVVNDAFEIIGVGNYYFLGDKALSFIGDYDNDGYQDFAYSNGDRKIEIVFGDEDQSFSSRATFSVGFTKNDSRRLDHTINKVGDFNGDSYDDFIIGMPNWWNGFKNNKGRAFLFLGNSDRNIDPSFEIGTELNNIWFATETAAIGDINKDGFDDIAIGSPFSPSNRVNIFLGSATPDLVPDQKINGGCNRFGSEILGNGDFNADNKNDVFIGCYSEDRSTGGIVYQYSWSGSGKLEVQNNAIQFNSRGSSFGEGLQEIQIVNKNTNEVTKKVLVVNSQQKRINNTSRGTKAFFYSLEDSLSRNLEIIGTISGVNSDERFSFDLDAVGDLNNDGFEDLVVGVPGSSVNGFRSGELAFYLGNGTSEPLVEYLSLETESIRLGSAISGKGDFNNDGFDDLIVGAPHPDETQTEKVPGEVFLILGAEKFHDFRIISIQENNHFDLFG